MDTDTKNKLCKYVKPSFWGAVLFALVSSPQVYNLTNRATNVVGFNTYENGCPTAGGLLLHTVVFYALVRGLMEWMNTKKDDDKMSSSDMHKYSMYGAVLFLALSNNYAYKLTRNVKNTFADENGCPTMTGVGAHALVYMVVLVLLMFNYKD